MKTIASFGSTRRGRNGPGQLAEGLLRVEGGVEECVQRPRLNRGEGFVPAEQALGDRVEGEANGSLRGPFGVARLEDVEATLLDRVLDVLHVAVVPLEPLQGVDQLGMGLGHAAGEVGQVLGVADAGDDVLALGVEQKVSLRLGGPGGRVSREGHPGARVRSAVAEDHPLHGDCGAELIRDPLEPPVGDRTIVVPRTEHCLDGTP